MLLATLGRTGPTHGYGLIAALRQDSDGTFDLPEGTVYPALHRLEKTGDVSSAWSSESGRKRRVYQLTGAGAETARGQAAGLAHIREGDAVGGRPDID